MKSQPVTIVVFGGTGDLMKRKLVPAFVSLFKQGILNPTSAIIGVGRRQFTSENYLNFLAEDLPNAADDIRQLPFYYFTQDFQASSDLSNLRKYLQSLGKEDNLLIYYLATNFIFFPSIVKQLQQEELHRHGSPRIVFEKPFGINLVSSNMLDREIHRVFSENQIYRVDHYLAKETVQNITALKLTNPFFDAILTNELVDMIELIVDEEIGVENRLDSYDSVGAVKDMIQSHLLQVISLLLMDAPQSAEAEALHDEKVAILQCLRPLGAERHLFGQYKSYRRQAQKYGISDSSTETFAKVVLECGTERWNGVDIVLRTGKKLGKKYGQICVHFKPLPRNIASAFSQSVGNKIFIDIYPNQDIRLLLNSRKPESERIVEPVEFKFCHEEYFGPNTSDEYAVLLRDILRGDKTLFTRFDELAESWRIVEGILAMRDKIRFVAYEDGSDPEESSKEKA